MYIRNNHLIEKKVKENFEIFSARELKKSICNLLYQNKLSQLHLLHIGFKFHKDNLKGIHQPGLGYHL